MPEPLDALLALFADYVIDGETEALEQACTGIDAAIDPAALLAGLAVLRGQRADPQRLARAEVRLRAALQLPLRGGPPCRAGSP
jgi:hypothetical protein